MSYADHLTHDPEAVYQDADLLQAQYEAESQEAAYLRSQGICLHSGTQGWPDLSKMKDGADAYFIELAQEAAAAGIAFPDGCICTEGCGRTFASDEEHRAAAAEAHRS